MNILILNRWVGYNEGGNETQVKDSVKQFIKSGHKVTIITTEGNALKPFGDTVKIHYIKSPQKYFAYGMSGIYYALLFNLKSFLIFVKLFLHGERFDVIGVFFSLEATLARVIRILFGVPYVMYMAGDTPLELIEAKRADGKIQISHFMNKQCLKYGYSAEVIPKGFDLNRYNPNVNPSTLVEKLKLQNKKIILTMCRLDPRKNLITLIEAAKILDDQNFLKDTVFVIAGDGVEKEFLTQKTAKFNLKDKIIFTGAVANTSDEHPMYYTMSSLFVLPTLYEGFGWVFLEAMACGVPIITTDAGSNPEIVGETGIMIPVKNPGILAEKIKLVLSNKELHSELSEAGLKKADTYSWELVSKKFIDYYENISKIKSNTLEKKLRDIGYIFYDAAAIIFSLFKDNVIFNKESQNFKVEGQKGGTDGSI